MAARDLVRALEADARSWRYDELMTRWSRAALRSAARSGAIQRVVTGRYAATEHADSVITRAHAATEALGAGSLTLGRAAASLWGLCDAEPDAVVVSAPPGARPPSAPWLRAWRTSRRLRGTTHDGLRVASAADAVVTSFDALPGDDASSAVFRAVQRRLASPEELRDAAASWRPIRRRAELMRAIADAEAGCESVLEAFGLHRVFTGPPFAPWIRQHRLLLDGVRVRLDMYHPATRTAVELDGETYHSNDEARARDVCRDALLASHGILTVRFRSRDLRGRPAWCREMVLRTIAARGVEPERWRRVS